MNRYRLQTRIISSGIISFLLIFILQFAYAQQKHKVTFELNSIPTIPDSTHEYFWDIDNQNWNLTGKIINSSKNINMVETVVQSYLKEQSTWINQNKIINIYNEHNLPESVEEFSWSDEFKRWDYLSKSIYFYDSIKRLTENVILKWNILKQDWVNYIRYRYYYSEYSDWTEMLMNSWDSENSQWINYYKYIHNFTGTNATELIILDWNKENNIWINYKRQTYNYYNDSLLNSKQTYNWSIGNEIWNCFRKYQYQYDSRRNLVQEDIYLCLVDTMAYSEIKYDYDEFDRRFQLTDKRWDKTNFIWNNYMKELNFYEKSSGIDENENITLITPNPATEYIILKYPINDRAEVYEIKFRIYDRLGIEITNLSSILPENSTEMRIDISSLSQGMYFIHAGNKVMKFIKI